MKIQLAWGAFVLSAAVSAAAPVLSHAADLFDAQTQGSLISDHRAARPGDLVTVLITETSSATNTANTTTTKTVGFGANGDSAKGHQNGGTLNFNNDIGGQAKLERTGKVLAQMSVVVRDVLPNGDLLVSGAEAININGERTNIRLKGRIRPVDIAENNTVASTRLADASIDYDGSGYLTDGSKPGWFSRFFGWASPW